MEHIVKIDAIQHRTLRSTSVRIRMGRILSGIAVLFMLFYSITKLMMTPPVDEGTTRPGYPLNSIPVIGLILLILIILYLIPRNSIFGAILITSFMGGAVASNFRIKNPLFSNTLFPIYFAVILWGGIYLRDELISQFIPFRKKEPK